MRKTRKTIKIISIITVAFILLVGIICGLGFLKIQRDKRNFQTTDGMIDTFMTETDFSSLDIDESKKKIYGDRSEWCNDVIRYRLWQYSNRRCTDIREPGDHE